ncbi:MAG: septum formation initiator family protein [Ginsengibacter sp.]
MKRIGSIFTNKFLLTGIAFVIWMLFFDRNDLPSQMKRMRQLIHLQESEELLSEKIENTKSELELLKTNPQTLEKYAREKYLMKKDNEDLFVITIDSSSLK